MRTIPTLGVAMGILLASLLAVGAVTSAAATGGIATAERPAPTSVHDCAQASPEDFATPEGGDAIGYVGGYWYDEPIVIAPDAGNESNSGGADGSTSNGTADGNTSVNGTAERNASTNQTADENATRDGTSDENSSWNGTYPSNGTSPANGTPLNASDGLSDRELDAVVARAAARVEAVRCESFTSVPTVRIENRSTVRASQRATMLNRSTALRQYDDARLATALLLGDRRNSTAARIETTSATTLGYYEPATDEIVVVSENASQARIDEPTLAHELVHALQDQLFDLDRFDANRTDAALAESGLIEGDASLVEYRYGQHCEDGDWGTDCLDASAGPTGDSGYLGLELFLFQPYNSGPRYVQSLYEIGGWGAVNAQFEDPPRSTETVLSGTVGDATLANASFSEPVVAPEWSRLDPVGEPRADRLGPGTIGAAMIAPTFDADGESIYGAQHVTNNLDESTLDPLNPYDYGIDATTGWAGDRLEVYRSVDDETATRWRTVWDDDAAAATFRERYVSLLDVRGASGSNDFVGTFHFDRGSSYSGSVSIRQNGSAVVVTHAPTVEALRALDPRAAREPREGTSSSMIGFTGSKEAAEDAIAGPGALGAILAACVAGLVLVAVGLRVAR